MEIKPLVRGICPICEKNIMNEKKTEYINGGLEFWVKFNDGSQACFAGCEDCYKIITPEQLKTIMQRQIVSWGEEIAAQLKWYYAKAVHLQIIRHARTKDGNTG